MWIGAGQQEIKVNYFSKGAEKMDARSEKKTIKNTRGFHSVEHLERECARLHIKTKRIPLKKENSDYFALVEYCPTMSPGAVDCFTILTSNASEIIYDGIIRRSGPKEGAFQATGFGCGVSIDIRDLGFSFQLS